MKTAQRKARRGEYEIIHNDERVLLTSSRVKTAKEVARLLAEGASEYDIYATYDAGHNYQQVRKHLLMPDQQ